MGNIFKYLLNYLKPNIYVNSIENINLNLLTNLNIKYVFCDLDNTLVPHFTKIPTKTSINFCNNIKNKGIKFYIISNNSNKRVSEFANLINADGYIANARKPFKNKILRFINKHKINTKQTMFIGDQFIFDIFVANRLNIKSILVLPKFKEDTSNMHFLIFLIEKYLYKKLTHDNINSDENITLWRKNDIF